MINKEVDARIAAARHARLERGCDSVAKQPQPKSNLSKTDSKVVKAVARDSQINDVADRLEASNDVIDHFQITVDGDNSITVNLDTTTQQLSVLLSDDQTSTATTSFDAVVEMRSQTGACLLPRLTSDTISTMQNPIAGMILHNIDNGVLAHVNNLLQFNYIPTAARNANRVANSIITFGDAVGTQFADTQVIVDPITNDMIFPSDSNITIDSITINNQPINATDAANKQYVDTVVSNITTFGQDTLNGTIGTIINTIGVTVNSIISVTRNIGSDAPSEVTTIGNLIVGSIVNNTSFTVYSTVQNDVDNFNWFIINP